MWVELFFVLTLNEYYKLDANGKYGKYFLFIPETFFCRNVAAECLSHYDEINDDDS